LPAWQIFLALGVQPPRQAPALQAAPSAPQEVPSGTAMTPHLPVACTQPSAVQGLPSSQDFGPPALQVPPLQTSPSVQLLPSSQALVPTGA
jgi:hypothetical protein